MFAIMALVVGAGVLAVLLLACAGAAAGEEAAA
jgi:hypothetical protein